MERRSLALGRGPLGFVIAGAAAVLLGLTIWQSSLLGRAAGSPPSKLERERTAVQFEHIAFPLLLDVERYRRYAQLRAGVPNAGSERALRMRINREFSLGAAFIRNHDEDVDSASPWAIASAQWTRARTLPAPYEGPLFDDLAHTLRTSVLYHVEDASGLEYDTNRYAQDFGDMIFSKLPASLLDVGRADVLAENAQNAGRIAIPQRIALAGVLSSMNPQGGDFDLSTDDWALIAAQMEPQGFATAQQAARYRDDVGAFSGNGERLANAIKGDVVMRELPRADRRRTKALTDASLEAIAASNNDLTALLDRQLAVRDGYAVERERYRFAMGLCAALVLLGIMLVVAELTAKRDREALAKARSESERLTAQLAKEKAEQALRLSEAQFRAVFDGASLGIAILDRNGTVLDANAVFRAMYAEGASAALEEHRAEFADLMRGERDIFEFKQHVMTPQGSEAWTDASVSVVNDEAGRPLFAIFMFRDLTELKTNERRLLHDMTHDALTGLPNRAHFERELNEQFTLSRNSTGTFFGVLLVDLDRFKDINESLGPSAGDFVIAQTAHRLQSIVEPGDLVCRLGSDEFAVLVRSLTEVLHVEEVARRALSALAKPLAVGSRSLFISATVGIALAETEYQRGEDVMRDAYVAMRYAKTFGGARFAVFDSKMHARAEKRLQLTTDMRLALERGEFDLLYQPIVRIVDGELVGCEALIRWNHPAEGTMLPADFMPLAEETGLAVPIGNFVLRKACEQASRWKRIASASGGLPINVNVSAAELLDPDFERVALGAVREFGVSPSDLTLEITESVVLDSGTRPMALVERLRREGFKICIDDFGTGYSSLRYLQQFKVDTIKIDRSFVCGQDGEIASEPIVRTLMTLAEAFDVRVVAEGIETQKQRAVLGNAGCRYGQGYYYARPLTAQALHDTYRSAFGDASYRTPA